MNIQLHQTVKLKPGNCKGKILPEGGSTGTCYLVQLIEVPSGKNSTYSVGSKLLVLKGNCWMHTQKIKVDSGVVSEQRIVFHVSDIIGTVIDTEDPSDGK